MANEISISLSINVSKNGAKFSRQESFTDDMSGDSWSTGIIEIADSSTQITDVQVVNYGWIYLKNCGTSASLYVDFGHDDPSASSGDDAAFRLYGGEACIVKLAAILELEAISSSGTQAVEYAIIEL